MHMLLVKPNSTAEAWCLQHGLARSARFQLTLYGHALANDLAQAWCHRMHFLWQLASGFEGPGPYLYQQSDFDNYVPPDTLTRALQSFKGKQLERAQHIADLGRDVLL